MDASLFAFLRQWAWPFDESDEDIAREGSEYLHWSREAGFEEKACVVFRWDDRALELALDSGRPADRLRLGAAEVNALEPTLRAYLEGTLALEAFARAHPAARAILALHHEAEGERAAAEDPDDPTG